MNRLNTLVLAGIFVLPMASCSKHSETVAQEIKKIKDAPPLTVETPPQMLPTPMFMYSSQMMRSPFMPPSLAQDISRMGDREVVPDFARPKQPLEYFPLEQMVMKGVIRHPGETVYGLVETPDKKIVKVLEGGYLGTNFGRITRISQTSIDVMEIVPNGSDGYVERPRSLIIAGASTPN